MIAVCIPWQRSDPYRQRALDYICDRYQRLHPDWKICIGELPEWVPWSKGHAVNLAVEQTDADTLVIADSDSFCANLSEATRLVETGTAWVVPHRWVFRLTDQATIDLIAGGEPRRNRLARGRYTGPRGGGITVVSREAFDTVGGIDPRFMGWGGEDIAFGLALDTLCGWGPRLDADLFHLWHPHPAPDLRGPPESEALVARYAAAKGVPRLMRAVIADTEPEPAVTLDPPARFWAEKDRLVVRVGDSDRRKAKFVDHLYETTDGDMAESLRMWPGLKEVG